MKTNYFFLIVSLFFVMQVSGAPTTGLQFTGASASYINVGQNSAFSPTQFTVEAWVYYQSTSGGYVISNEGWDGTNGAQGFSIRTSGTKIELVLGSNGSWPSLQSSTDIPLNTWFHLAATYSGTEMKLYVNGVENASTSAITPMVTSNQNLSIGEGSMWKDRRFTGKMGDMRFWNVVRTQSEIFAAMSSSLVGTETGLVANWKMNEGTGSQVADVKNSFNLTKPDEVLWFVPSAEEEIVVQAPTKGLIFDGSKANSYVDFGQQAAIASPSEFTVEALVNYSVLSGGYILSSEGHTTEAGAQGFSLRLNGDKIDFTVGANSTWPGISAPASPALDTWIHVAATYSATAMKLYVNGLEVASLSNPAAISASTQNLIMGEGSMWKSRGLRGKLGYVRMWNVAKSKSEIRAGINTYVTGSEANLLAAWNNDVKDNTVLPEIKNTYAGTIGSDVEWFGFLTSTESFIDNSMVYEYVLNNGKIKVMNKSNTAINLSAYSITGQTVFSKSLAPVETVEQDIQGFGNCLILKIVSVDGQVYTRKVFSK